MPDSAERIPATVSTHDHVKRAQRGDRSAFRALYEDHVGHVFAVCLRLCGERQRAHDMTQDTFVNAWSGLERFNLDSSFRTWIHRIAVNTSLSALKKSQRRLALVEEHNATSVDTGASVDNARTIQTRMDIDAAIQLLPERARVVFVLHEIEGYRHNEIAELLNIAVGTSKAHLFNARKLLIRHLGQ